MLQLMQLFLFIKYNVDQCTELELFQLAHILYRHLFLLKNSNCIDTFSLLYVNYMISIVHNYLSS